MRILTGMAIGLESLEGYDFRADCTYVCCRICGRVFQSELDRAGDRPIEAYVKRKEWAEKHAKTHLEKQHELLRKSGLFCTPEAAQKLAAIGIIDLEQIIMNNEFEAAYREAPRAPQEEAEY